MARVSVYVDGFNLYYRLRGTRFKWLDLDALCRNLVDPADTLVGIKYFTARVRGTPGEPLAPVRQQTYLNALETFPNIQIFYGRFSKQFKWMPPRFPPPNRIEVIKMEEKGSDVALATEMVADAFQHAFDVAAMISNDSDLCPPMSKVQSLGLRVHVFNPQPATASPQIAKAADHTRAITDADLAGAQLPAEVRRAGKPSLLKPRSW